MANEKNVPLYYLATMIPVDDEDRARIKRHLKEREGWGFETIEQGQDICQCLEGKVQNEGFNYRCCVCWVWNSCTFHVRYICSIFIIRLHGF